MIPIGTTHYTIRCGNVVFLRYVNDCVFAYDGYWKPTSVYSMGVPIDNLMMVERDGLETVH